MCAQVLRSSASPKEVRRARGLALKELGGIFLDAAAAHLEVAPQDEQEQVRPGITDTTVILGWMKILDLWSVPWRFPRLRMSFEGPAWIQLYTGCQNANVQYRFLHLRER